MQLVGFVVPKKYNSIKKTEKLVWENVMGKQLTTRAVDLLISPMAA